MKVIASKFGNIFSKVDKNDNDVSDKNVELGPDTLKYLSEVANESMKRQFDLDEAVWRSLPFFAAAFAFVATIIGKSAADVPQWGGGTVGNISLILLMLSVLSLAWSLRWMWVMLKPREYEYPAPDEMIRRYAIDVHKYHVAVGELEKVDIDEKVSGELKMFMIEQYGNASATNFSHNAVKLKARPKALLFILFGFALAFACEALIFIDTHVGTQPTEQGVVSDAAAAKCTGVAVANWTQCLAATPTREAKISIGDRRGELLGLQLQTGNQEQAMSRGRTPTPPPSSSINPQRPKPPAPQFLAKDRALNEGVSHPTPTPTSARKD